MDIGGKCGTACNFRENIFIYRLSGWRRTLHLIFILFSLCSFTTLFVEIFRCALIHRGLHLHLSFI